MQILIKILFSYIAWQLQTRVNQNCARQRHSVSRDFARHSFHMRTCWSRKCDVDGLFRTNGHNKILVNIFFSFFSRERIVTKNVPLAKVHITREERIVRYALLVQHSRVKFLAAFVQHSTNANTQRWESPLRGDLVLHFQRKFSDRFYLFTKRVWQRASARMSFYPTASTCALKNEILRYPPSSF